MDLLVPFEDTFNSSTNSLNTSAEPAAAPGVTPVVVKEHPDQEEQTPILDSPAQDASATVKNPVMILNEMRPGLAFQLSETSPASPSTRQFTVTVEVEGQSFQGSGASKKLAKQAVAKAVLSKIYK